MVSNLGEVYSILSKKILKARIVARYAAINVYHIGKMSTKYIHRMVAETFLEKFEASLEVNHKDGNRLNNSADNLEWITHAENLQHALDTGLRVPVRGVENGKSKLSEADVLEIKQFLSSNGYTQKEIAESFNVTGCTINNIVKGKRWSHITGWTPENNGTIKFAAKLTAEDIPKIRAMFAEGKTNAQIAKIYQTHNGTISAIRLGKNWKNY